MEDAAARLIPQRTEALRLLIGYVGLLEQEAACDPELYLLAVTHVHDLIALALGATGDGAAMALGLGVRAARLMAIKHAVMRETASHDLSVVTVARRQGVSPRYVHRLFEAEGTPRSCTCYRPETGPRLPAPDEPEPCASQDCGHRLFRRLRRRVPLQSHVPPPLWTPAV